MGSLLTDEQVELGKTIRSMLDRHLGSGIVATSSDELWKLLSQAGLTAMRYPERLGGMGASLRDTSVVVAELGRVLSSDPFFVTEVLAGNTLRQLVSDDSADDYLAALAAGDVTATLVTGFPFSSTPISGVDVAGAAAVSGVAEFVLQGCEVDSLVVVAHGSPGLQVGIVDPGAGGVQRTALESLDGTRPLARVEFDNVPFRPFASGAEVASGLLRAQSEMLILLAAEQVAAARVCLEMTVTYVKDRTQFGRPIGSFQAVKHQLADMLMAIDLAEAALGAATDDHRDTGPRDFELLAHTTHALAAQAFTLAAEESIHLHGGIGFTWELPLHRFFRRAKADELLFGTTDSHYAAIADLLLAS